MLYVGRGRGRGRGRVAKPQGAGIGLGLVGRRACTHRVRCGYTYQHWCTKHVCIVVYTLGLGGHRWEGIDEGAGMSMGLCVAMCMGKVVWNRRALQVVLAAVRNVKVEWSHWQADLI